ncbi:Alpha/Beta hydrolase protein [Umbelopsis sp. PMI_123]|nr:Alpha/Beta hydrolase protein [Umbelopsis sp. PMI_123]
MRTTLLCSLLQALTSHGQLGELQIVRFFTSIPTIPPPFSCDIHELTFIAQSKGLPGVLKELDESELNTREIQAEWIADKSIGLIQRILQSKSRSHAVDFAGDSSPRVILYVHGGAMVLMSTKTHRHLTYNISKSTGLPVFSVNYRLAPEHPFPAALQDVVLSFLHLIDQNEGYGYDPENIMIMGDSAGGGLALSMMLYMRDHGLPLPGAASLLSPWVDLSMSHASWSNQKYDYLPLLTEDHPIHATKMYLGSNRYPHLITHPYVSPVYADNFDDLPPILLQAGGCECLHDEIQELATKIAQSNTYVQLEVYEDMIHVFQAFTFLRASKKALQSIGWWSTHAVNIIHKWQSEVISLKRELERLKSLEKVND